MRVEDRVLRWPGLVGTLVATALTLVLVPACQQLRTLEEPPVPPPIALESSAELPVVMSPLGGRARRTVSRADSIQVGIHFDPDMLDVGDVASYVLWGRTAESATWQRIKEIPLAELPIMLSFKEGTVGLRASAKLTDGEEVFIPATGDEPVVWLVVDRSAPSLTWLRPAADAPVSVQEPVTLVWTLNEVEVGVAPSALEWSNDSGTTWNPIASVEPQVGHQSHVWKTPPGLLGPCEVRVTASDLVGHATSSVVRFELVATGAAPVDFTRPPPAARPAVGATTVAGVSREPSGRATTSGPSGSEGEEKTAAGALATTRTGPLSIEPLPTSVLGGGKSAEVRWRAPGLSAEQQVQVEWSRDGGRTWEAAAAAPASAGAASWEVPCVDLVGCLLRLRADLSGESAGSGQHMSVGSRPFVIDCSPPSVTLVSVPEMAGRTARFELRWDDGRGSGLAEVSVFLRDGGGAPPGDWRPVPASIATLEPDPATPGRAFLSMDFAAFSEGAYEIHVQATDRVGNRTAVPGRDTAGTGSFALDKTPPRLVVTPYPLSWVEGMTADIQIDADWRDVELPVILFGRGPRTTRRSGGGATSDEWQELARWTRLPPNTRQFSWNVPTGFSELSVKVEATDRAGNRSSAVINSRRVEPAIYLKDFAGGAVVDGGTTRRILWELHSAAVRRADELRVQVEYQEEAGREWKPVCRDLTVLEQCVWEVPPGDGADGHRIRLRLERGGQLVSEYRSEPFTIRAGRPTFQEPLIPQSSMEYFDIARTFVEKYRAQRRELAGKTVTPADKDRLDDLVQHAKESFGKSLELAENNYHAAYGYAQFLNRLPERDERQVERLLQQVLQFNPTHHWACNDLGALYIKEQRYSDAVTLLGRAVKLEPSADVHYNLGLALFHERKMVEARAQFQAALTSQRQGRVHHGVLYYYMIHTFLQEGLEDQAEALYRKEGAKIPPELRERLQKVFET